MIKLSYGGTAILFDSAFPDSKRGMRCVSHAHSDHVSGGGLVVSTAGTAALMRGVWDMEARFKTLEYGEPLKHRGLKITPHNAGHVLGSSMFHVEADGLDLLYTGDINTAETLTTKPPSLWRPRYSSSNARTVTPILSFHRAAVSTLKYSAGQHPQSPPALYRRSKHTASENPGAGQAIQHLHHTTSSHGAGGFESLENICGAR
jgi:hypothetical protein